jgi:hypothetical protein
VGYFWGFETDGIFQNQEQVDNNIGIEGKLIQSKAKPGYLKYIDKNCEGILNDEHEIELGDPNPNFIYDLSFNSSYKTFDFQLGTNDFFYLKKIEKEIS